MEVVVISLTCLYAREGTANELAPLVCYTVADVVLAFGSIREHLQSQTEQEYDEVWLLISAGRPVDGWLTAAIGAGVNPRETGHALIAYDLLDSSAGPWCFADATDGRLRQAISLLAGAMEAASAFGLLLSVGEA